MTGMLRKGAGFVLAPVAWAAATQLGQVFPYIDCQKNTSWSLAMAGVGIAMAVAGLVVSYPDRKAANRSDSFIGCLGIGMSLIFTLALLLQAAASVLVHPCNG